MRDFLVIATLVVLHFLWAPLGAQHYLFNAREISVENGLPARQVSDVAQDGDGFIWISSRLGIHRFDGYSYKTYGNTDLELPDRNAGSLVFDRQNRLWYGKWEPLGRPLGGVLSLDEDSLVSVINLPDGNLPVENIYSAHALGVEKREMLVVTKSGILYHYDAGWEEICRWPTVPQGFFTAWKTSDGDYWVCNDQDVFRVKRRQIQKISSLPTHDQAFITGIFMRKGIPIFETNTNNKCVYYTLKGGVMAPFRIKGESSMEIMKILQIHSKYTVYAKEDSLIVRDTLGKLLYSVAFPGGPSFIKKPPFIQNTFLDRQSNLWIASRNGLLRLSGQPNPFTIINSGIGVPGILKDGEQLWLSGDPNYLMLDLARGAKQTNPFPYPATCFLKDQRGHILIGTQNGLLDYTPDSLLPIASRRPNLSLGPEQFKRFLTGNQIRVLFQNPVTGNYWLAGSRPADHIGEGYMFDLDQDRIGRALLPDSLLGIGIRVRQFFPGHDGIWLVTNKGLFVLDKSTETLIKHYSRQDGLPFDDLYYLYQDASGVFWLGSNGGGLIRWDRKNNYFRQFTTEHGLSNNHLYAVVEDDYGVLWLPSDFGLMAFDKSAFTTKLYLPENGIALEEFNFSSFFQDRDGTLYFGGPAGITSFHPSALHKMKEDTVPLKLTQVRVLKSEKDSFQDRTPEFLKTGKLQMYPGDQIIEISLALLDFRDPGRNQFAYRIRGYQEQWVHTQSHAISLFSLPYGHYELVVKGRGASGSWNPVELSIPLHIQAPFYRQAWFITCMLFLTIAIMGTGVHLRFRSLKRGKEQLEAEVKKRTRQLEAQNRQIETDKQTIATQAEELKALDKAKTRFFSNITHEFRTPLTLIIGPVEQLLNENLPKAAQRRLSGVAKNARQLLNLINQLLDLSKLEGGRMKVEAVRGDLVAYTRELVQRFQPLAVQKGQRLAFVSSRDHWETHFDQGKWDKIIYNLTANAIKFTPESGAVQLSLSTMTRHGEEWIHLTVKDTGPGIEGTQLERIFDRFYQADDSSTRVQSGTGIGLSLVKELVELQGGEIQVASAAGQGASFEVRLPVLRVESEAGPLAALPAGWEIQSPAGRDEPYSTKEAPPPTGTDEEKLELLVVEDNGEMREYIRYCLDETKYNIIEAGDGEEGLKKAQALIPDLIISDVMMPKKNGFALTEAIRGHTATSHIPLILLTAKASLDSRLQGLRRGADAYLTKPFSPQELALRIEKLIEIRRLLQRRYQNGPPPAADDAYRQEDEFIADLRAYVIEHIDEADLGVDHLCKHVGMSRVHLYRKMKALTDQGPGEFVRTIRVDTARNLIREGKLNLSEIAYQTGFSSLSHFSRTFKKVYGKSPSDLKGFD